MFVVRIWVERRESNTTDASDMTWRGVVEHLPDGERRYVKRISEMLEFIIPYMEAMGISFGAERWVKPWLRVLRYYKRIKRHTWTAP